MSAGASTSANISGLSPSTAYYWQVCATGSGGVTYANGGPTAFWNFATGAGNQTPSVISVTPSSGSGAAQTFTYIYSDPNGYADIAGALALVNGSTAADNGSTLKGAWTVTNQAPSPTSVSPSSGSGSSQTFSFAFADPNGAGDIASAQMMLNTSIGAATACYVAYAPSTNQLYLVNDAGNGVLGPVTAGTATTLQNSRCIVNAAGSSASASGTTLTVTVA